MTTTPGTLDDIYDGCGPDCIYIDGACRCYHGESTSREFDIPGFNGIISPF